MNQLTGWLRNNHMLLMVIGCGLPLIVLAAIYVFNVPLGSVALVGVMLLCPLMHLFMMRGMGHGNHQASCHGGAQPNSTESDSTVGKADQGLQLAENSQKR